MKSMVGSLACVKGCRKLHLQLSAISCGRGLSCSQTTTDSTFFLVHLEMFESVNGSAVLFVSAFCSSPNHVSAKVVISFKLNSESAAFSCEIQTVANGTEDMSLCNSEESAHIPTAHL